MRRKINLLLDKGILATDERPESLGKKFKEYGIENNKSKRLEFRSLLYSTPELEKYIGGIIFHKEIFAEENLKKICRDKNILIGIKLDEGLTGEHSDYISQGIDNLKEEIIKYSDADFAKWRCLFTCKSSLENIKRNCKILSEYAKICIENNIIPIVEPEILWEEYSLEEMSQFARQLYSELLPCLDERIILKCSFITPGKNYAVDIKESARATVKIFDDYEKAFPGAVFLSGGHSSEFSISLLKEIQQINTDPNFKYSFSFGRALTNSALKVFSQNGDVQEAFLGQLKKLK